MFMRGMPKGIPLLFKFEMKNSIYISVTIMILSSCGFIRLLNTSKEQDESNFEIERFLKKRKYLYDYSFQAIDSLDHLKKTEIYKINTLSDRVEYIQLRIYDSIGNLYTGFSQCMGDFNRKKIIDSFPVKQNTFPYLNKNLKFKNELNLINASDVIKQEILEKCEKKSYTFVVYYTIWTNYFSEHVLKEVSKIKANYDNTVLVLYVNTAKDVGKQ
jgi:hypothetical protein